MGPSLVGVLPSDGLVWRLHGSTSKDVEAYVTPTPIGHWLVRIVRDYESILDETYPDSTSAMARTGELLEGLVAKGWVQVPTGIASSPATGD